MAADGGEPAPAPALEEEKDERASRDNLKLWDLKFEPGVAKTDAPTPGASETRPGPAGRRKSKKKPGVTRARAAALKLAAEKTTKEKDDEKLPPSIGPSGRADVGLHELLQLAAGSEESDADGQADDEDAFVDMVKKGAGPKELKKAMR